MSGISDLTERGHRRPPCLFYTLRMQLEDIIYDAESKPSAEKSFSTLFLTSKTVDNVFLMFMTAYLKIN